jgi:hypothetical protein
VEITRHVVSEIQTGRATVGTTCTRLSDDNTIINRGVRLRAHPDNAGTIYVGSHQMVCEPGAVAYATHYSPNENDDVVFHAPAAGAEYNGVEFGWFDDAPPGMPPEIVQVADRFEVHFALGETTAMDVKAAFDCAGFDWTATVSGDGSGLVETVGIDFSVGGADGVTPDGFALGPGEEVTIPVDRLSKVFAVGDTEGQVVSWFAG